jgi:hypothetical protein
MDASNYKVGENTKVLLSTNPRRLKQKIIGPFQPKNGWTHVKIKEEHFQN